MELSEAIYWLNIMRKNAEKTGRKYFDENSQKKAEAIDTVLKALEDSIPKEKVREKIEEIIKNNSANEDWDGTDYTVTSEEDFAIEKLEELL